ncbi:hypothetical protein BMF35_a0439 [Aurantiacibacter gangjinensis]|uniref:Uncharacterized protein n=2 Tax=Aurantiacibacter gangjinensis TaxID=502682 RepID=A0A0G9ML97_9SPHN|nr:hypothetical protein BMF35_a0439 [Aurantiacibacter gangjinensis]KLE31384.1 hypothetical protein AAW01_07210 [Aurantiacibacter gangjinensis]
MLAMPVAAQDHGPGDGTQWKLDPFARVELGIVSAESSDREEELIVNGDGGFLRAQAGVEFGNHDTQIRFEADRIFVERFGSATGRDSFDRDRLTVSLDQKLGEDFEVQLRARAYDDLVTIESADTDERQAALRLEYEPVLDHRARVQVTWRDREYDDGQGPDGSSSQGDGWRVDGEYRHRIGRYHYVNFDLRAEEINSDNPLRSYTRESASVSYTRPITRDLRVRPALEVRHTRFEGRITPSGDPREDTQIVPEVELLYWPGDWRIEAEAKYIFSASNDPVRDRQGYRLSLTVGYVF